uniref:ATP-dependent Clp protease proteolytic subunit n=1 Tax=Hedysarum polybotrys TaxID=119828 RepID=A0A8F5J7K8_9FABA|nr:ATP-dependent Clp protease proteolytic subunit [Hedysarum polybotrys]
MPIGIPKVPFFSPGDDDSSWGELYNLVYRSRVLVLGEEITHETANNIGGLMIYLSLEDKKRDIHLLINSKGGGMLPGLAIYDIMQCIIPEVHTLCIGIAASMASLLLVGGTITKRAALPHAKIMIHEPVMKSFDSGAGNALGQAIELEYLRNCVAKIYAERTGKPLWHILHDLDRNDFFTPEDAQAYGLIDEIAHKK